MKQFFLSFALVMSLFASFTISSAPVAYAEPLGKYTCADGQQHPSLVDANDACKGFGGTTKIPTGCPGGAPNPAPDANVTCPGGGSVVKGTYNASANSCGTVATSINYGCGDTKNGGPIYGFLRAIIKFASGLVGLVVIMMLIIGGIRYITSAGDSKMVASAKNQIVNAVTGLVLFGLMLAILNFLLPGGIIG